YFPVVREDGNLLPVFIGVRNGGSDHLDTVIAGNEKVLRARLADARFFFAEDTSRPLSDYVSRLSGMMYQKDLGTMLDKVHRLERLAADLSERLHLAVEEKEALLRSATLCKADLVT